ncbi:PQQ-dependent sugar dehydrogenase [candidate division WWE3 bacterium]|jgi:glucose/arabinose dehydrogenase|uniref:PQQ-dependent sugar dehydrogenase n=1 Tax=candidate division WWE3 bacterium TaxID=2053526 RepID=A0A3A4ZMV5_UNCKA|nr:MAG: PQQ-dependent sugar dehydrogenase [candidate division WWE3 bacterium]
MKKVIYAFIFTLVVFGIFGAIWLSNYLALFKEVRTSFNNSSIVSENENDVPYKIELVAEGLSVPWGIVFTSDDRFLFTERTGSIREFKKGKLSEKSLLILSDVNAISEAGLMGLEKDPDYPNSKYLYTSYAYSDNGNLKVRIVRLIDGDSELTVDKVILENIPAASNHAGSRLKFGPEGKLYITTGDATQRNLAQDINSLAGKILRLNPDGSIPEDNPFDGSPVYSYGHRNPQGIAWNPETGTMYSTEHGPSVFDGPAGGDEINIIYEGGNYGWPLVSHEKTKEGMVSPAQVFTPAVAPASAMAYSGKLFPQFKYNLFFGALRGEGLYRIILEGKTLDKVAGFQKLPEVDLGRIRDVVESPSGEIYFSTSNTDGRGNIRTGDDKIFKITPNL